MNTAEPKGINFKQTPQGQLVLIQPETLQSFLNSLTKNERGWIELNFELYKKISKRGLFANVHPVKKQP